MFDVKNENENWIRTKEYWIYKQMDRCGVKERW